METFLTKLPVAHRGLHDDSKPENSLSAYRAAAEAGYAMETDVRFSKDGKLVILHDDDLRRLAGDPRRVDECTLAELKKLRLMGTDEEIPTFEEFLEAVDGRAPLLIEIKDMPHVKGEQIARAIAEEIDRLGYKGEYAIQSFNPFYVKAYKKLRPDILCGILANRDMADKNSSLKWKIEAHFLSRLKFNFFVKPDFVSYGFWTLPHKWVTKFKGIKLAWTVRSPEDEAKARTYADNIIFEDYLAKK